MCINLCLDPSVVAEISAFDNAVAERQKWMLAAQKAHVWDGIPEFPADPCMKLKAIADALTTQAEAYEKAIDDKQKLLLKAELGELKARAALVPHKDAVLALIERMKVKALLTKCKDDLKTKPISDKSKEFATNAVTAPLRQALKEEFEALGVAHMAPRLAESVERGKMKYKLALDVVIPAQIRDILSEGEQRAIALGCFLAELRTGGHGGGIVFDDPVSSLDHTRRQNVARRLVEEAKTRQVIIFTHDTSFLGELRDLIEQTGIEHLIHHLECIGLYTSHSPSSRSALSVNAATRTSWIPCQIVFTPGSPSPFRPKNPPTRATSRKTSFRVGGRSAGRFSFVSR